MDQDEPGRNSPQSGGQRPVSTVRSYSRLRSYTGHGNLTLMPLHKSAKVNTCVTLKFKAATIVMQRRKAEDQPAFSIHGKKPFAFTVTRDRFQSDLERIYRVSQKIGTIFSVRLNFIKY